LDPVLKKFYEQLDPLAPQAPTHPKKTIKGNLIGQVKCKKLGVGAGRACVKNLVMQ